MDDEAASQESPLGAAPRMFRPGIEISTWSELKFARGAALMRDLQGAIELWNARAPFTTDKVISDDGLTVDVILRNRFPAASDEWALILGDAIHNLRSALDALAWELVHLDGGKPKKPRSVFFPVLVDENDWANAVEPLVTAPPDAIEVIRRVQPFTSDEPAQAALKILTTLSNQDKHKVAIRVAPTLQAIDTAGTQIKFENEADIPDPPCRLEVTDRPAMDDGALLMRFTSSAKMVSIEAPLTLGSMFTVDVNGQAVDLGSVANSLVQAVRIVLNNVYAGLPSDQPPAPSDGPEWQDFDIKIMDQPAD